MTEHRLVVVCRGFRYKSKKLKDMFNGHPKVGYAYKAYIESDGSLKVILPSSDATMFGIKFDRFNGDNQDYYYDFMDYDDKMAVMYLAPETLTYNSFEDLDKFIEEGDGKKEVNDFDEIEYDNSEAVVENMSLEQLMEHPDVLLAYQNSILSVLRGHSGEIYKGLVYSIEHVLDLSSEGLEIPQGKNHLLDELVESLKELDVEEGEEELSRICVLFFTLLSKLNQGL